MNTNESAGGFGPEIEEEPSRFSSAMTLQTLLASGNMDRLESESRRFLELDPEDIDAHFFLAIALIELERTREAWPHVQFLISTEPEDPDTHLAAMIWYRTAGRWKGLKKHVDEALRLNPDNAVFHYYAALYETQRIRIPAARRHIDRARELDPDNVDIANLAIRIKGIETDSAVDAWQGVEEYREALKREPENAILHNGLGDVFLDRLDLPRDAEFHYREALRIAPTDPVYQKDLFNAVAKRNLIYRLVSLPSRTFEWIGHLGFAISRQPWRLIFLVIAFKAVIAFLIWLLLVTVVFWPAGKIYEWLLVSEIKAGARASAGQLRWWFRFQRLPIAFRFALFVLMIGLAWAGLFHLLSIPLVSGFIAVGIFMAVHFGFIVVFFLIRQIRSAIGKQQARARGIGL